MADPPFPNDEAAAAAPRIPDLEAEAEAFGRAALLLVESLIHGLVARAIITIEDAIEIAEVAAEAKDEADGADHAGRPTALTMLAAIAASLRIDLPG